MQAQLRTPLTEAHAELGMEQARQAPPARANASSKFVEGGSVARVRVKNPADLPKPVIVRLG